MEDVSDLTLTGDVFWHADPKLNGGCNGVYETMQRHLSLKQMSAMNRVSKQTKETTDPWMKEAKEGPMKAVTAPRVRGGEIFRPHISRFAKIGLVHHWRHRTP